MNIAVCSDCFWIGQEGELNTFASISESDSMYKIIKSNNLMMQCCPQCGNARIFRKITNSKITFEKVTENTLTIDDVTRQTEDLVNNSDIKEADLELDLEADILEDIILEAESVAKDIVVENNRVKIKNEFNYKPSQRRNAPKARTRTCDECEEKFQSLVETSRCDQCNEKFMKKFT